MVERDRKNKGYPTGWRVRKRGNSFYISYQIKPSLRHKWGDKSETLLGKGETLSQAEKQAYYTWASKISSSGTPMTLKDLIEKYQLTVVPKKSKSTQSSNNLSLKRISAVLDLRQPVTTFKTHQAFQYRDYVHTKMGAKYANLDKEVLSHMFSKAIEWGCDIAHPIKNLVGKIPIPSRDRYVTDDELKIFLKCCNPFLKVYVPLKIATGKDKGMLLRMKLSDITKDGIYFPKRKKTGKGKTSFLPFIHNDECTGLSPIIDNIVSWRSNFLKVQSFYLFCSSYGKPMITEDGTTSNFDSQWQRAKQKALKNGLTESFTEHDLRAKTASDLENLEQAAQLLQHSSSSTTQRIYRRKPDVVLPFKSKV